MRNRRRDRFRLYIEARGAGLAPGEAREYAGYGPAPLPLPEGGVLSPAAAGDILAQCGASCVKDAYACIRTRLAERGVSAIAAFLVLRAAHVRGCCHQECWLSVAKYKRLLGYVDELVSAGER